MNCSQADALIQRSLDGALSPRERQNLDIHLASCATCQSAWDQYRRLARAATVWTRRPASDDDPGEAFTDRVMAQITSRGSRPETASLPLWHRLTLVVAALVGLIACSFSFPLHGVTVPSAPPELLSRPQSALSLISWLGANFHGLPSEIVSLWNDLLRTVSVSGTMLTVLAATLLLNGLLYTRVVRNPAAR